MEKSKPLALVHDPVRGGAPLDFIRDEECPAEMKRGVFVSQATDEPHDVIVWHRIKDFQLVRRVTPAHRLHRRHRLRGRGAAHAAAAWRYSDDGSWRLLDRRASYGR